MSDPAGQITVIAPDAVLRGELTFQHAARILGQVEGKITTPGQIEVAQGAVCKAAIDASVVIVDGTIEGDVIARERLELSGSAIINGDITTAKFIVAEGATFTGHCTVSHEAASRARSEAVPAAAPAATKPTVKTTAKPRLVPQIAEGPAEIENALAGLEAKLAGFTKRPAAAE